MAKTYTKQHLKVLGSKGDSGCSYEIVDMPEGANETFIQGAPVVITGGYVVEAANPVTAVWGFAAEAASNNGTAGAVTVGVIPCTPGMEIEANFLAASAADNVLAVTDLGSNFRIAYNATVIGGDPGWYVEDTGTTTAVQIIDFQTSPPLPDNAETAAKAGDTNARVRCKVLQAVNTWDA